MHIKKINNLQDTMQAHKSNPSMHKQHSPRNTYHNHDVWHNSLNSLLSCGKHTIYENSMGSYQFYRYIRKHPEMLWRTNKIRSDAFGTSFWHFNPKCIQ